MEVRAERARCAWPNPMCGDPTTMQWFDDVTHGRTPSIDRIGISYMLLGETGADFDHPESETPPPGKTWYRVGPHVMPQSAGDLMKGYRRRHVIGFCRMRGRSTELNRSWLSRSRGPTRTLEIKTVMS